MDPVVEFRSVSKKFEYRKDRPESLKALGLGLLTGKFFKSQRETRVVLDDVSFEVHRGEVVGIMGRNGVGKSTMLRILSGIYQADSGQVIVRGRIAPLVALGAGFHPDLSGLENIYLNAAILGIPRKAIAPLVPTIIDFSELKDAIYDPMRTYSTGMGMRLGFSIASHVDAPIIILDEVLGVGDQGFQAKCTRRMDELFKSGRTIIIVAHDPSLVAGLCTRCLIFEKGKILFDGTGRAGAERYLELFGR